MLIRVTTILCLVLSTLMRIVNSTATATLPCGACMLLVNELEESIRSVDPLKKIEIGSYRVDPNGNQRGLQQVALSRSQSHIIDLMEKVCDKANEYALIVNPLTGKAVYVNSKSTYLKGEMNASMKSKLQQACDDFIDEHGDSLEKFLQKERESPAKELCHKNLGVCSSVDVSAFPPNDPPEEVQTEEEQHDEAMVDEL